MKRLEVLFTPADFTALSARDLSQTVCVVFDVLRATSSMITALANGAVAIHPVSDIPEALELRRREPHILLAGERDGLRIRKDLTGSIDFDLGNSPREFVAPKVNGRSIVMTTTNGTRALRACATARRVLAGAFLNLTATAGALKQCDELDLLLVCSGTFEQTAYEDVLGAGALCELLLANDQPWQPADSAEIARKVFLSERQDLPGAIGRSRNGRRLLSRPELSGDVAFCAQVDKHGLIAELGSDGRLQRGSFS